MIMHILTTMSEEENIHDNPDLPNSEEEVTSTEPETEPIAVPELEQNLNQNVRLK